MNKLFGAALLAIPLMAAPVHAHGFGACFGPYKIQAGVTLGGNFSVTPGCPPGGGGFGGGGGGGMAGPWYQYWPLEAHFQTPALPQYPYWPSPQGLPPATGMGMSQPYSSGYPGAYPSPHGASVHPAGYYGHSYYGGW